MPFPSNPTPGQQYPNTDNGFLYEWQDPPGAWSVIGTIDDGNTPGGPGDGLVEGTEPRFQWFKIAAPGPTSHSADDISVRVDTSKMLDQTDYASLEFGYSYDLSTWNLGVLSGGNWSGIPVNIARGTMAGGGQLWVTKENGGSSNLFKSSDGINWTVNSVTGPGNNYQHCGVSRGNILLTSNGTSNPTDYQVWYSSDEGATWSSTNLSYRAARDSTYIDDDVAIIGQRDGTACRVSIDGGANFQAMSGIPTGITNWTQVRITASVTGPKTFYAKDMQSSSGNLYYITLADLESGNRAWTPVTGGSSLFLNTQSKFFQCWSDGTQNYIVEVASAQRALIMKLNAAGTGLEDWRILYPLPLLGVNDFYTSLMYSMPQPAKMILGRSAVSIGNTNPGAAIGFVPDLYFNGVKIAFSDLIRTDFS